MIDYIFLGIFVTAVIVGFAWLCGMLGEDLEKLNKEMRELRRRQKERGE